MGFGICYFAKMSSKISFVKECLPSNTLSPLHHPPPPQKMLASGELYVCDIPGLATLAMTENHIKTAPDCWDCSHQLASRTELPKKYTHPGTHEHGGATGERSVDAKKVR